jgi:hypothetical protein
MKTTDTTPTPDSFEARILAFDASEAFQLDPNTNNARALLVAVHAAPSLSSRLTSTTRKAQAWLERAEGQGAI